MGHEAGGPVKALGTIAEGLVKEKCRCCGCMASALSLAAEVLSGQDREAALGFRRQFETIAYDCRGCARCFGAEATVQLTEQFGDAASCCSETHCGYGASSAEAAVVRLADPSTVPWPPYPGDYHVGDRGGSVAVCTLSDRRLAAALITRHEPTIAIAGRCDTENIGIEKVVLNLISRPQVRWLILCGDEAPGHRAGDALLRLAEHGVDGQQRIVGAAGWRPVLKNVLPDEAARFREQVTMVNLIGVTDLSAILAAARAAASSAAAPLPA